MNLQLKVNKAQYDEYSDHLQSDMSMINVESSLSNSEIEAYVLSKKRFNYVHYHK